MKEYDIAFSLGSGCSVSQALRGVGRQYASFPLDWVAVKDITTGVRSIANDFKGWFEAEDLELNNVSHSAGFLTRFYLNRKTGIGFAHEFNDFEPFTKVYPKVRRTYERRIARFQEALQEAKRILAIWAELPTHGCPDVAIYRAALAELRAKCPHAMVDLLCFVEEPGVKDPCVKLDADGLTIVACDFRKMNERGIAHYVDFAPFMKYLAANVSVPDTRTPEEKSQFLSGEKKIKTYRWGPDKSAVRRRLNQWAYKAFRQLEGILQRKGLIHSDASLWFWDDVRREAEGGMK